MRLFYYFDKEADIFYLSQGKPSAGDITRELDDDVVIRISPRTKKIRGFTVLNFTSRLKKGVLPVSLPIHAELTPV